MASINQFVHVINSLHISSLPAQVLFEYVMSSVQEEESLFQYKEVDSLSCECFETQARAEFQAQEKHGSEVEEEAEKAVFDQFLVRHLVWVLLLKWPEFQAKWMK